MGDRITVITPSYNQGNYLEATIKSVLGQNYHNLQYIIIDGGSTDNSIEIIQRYQIQLDYWVSEKDGGQTEAINKGLKLATGDIITWVNSDDELLPNTLATIAKFYKENPDVDLIHGNTILHWTNGKQLRKKCNEEDLSLKYFAGMPFSQPSAFFTKRIVQKVGFLTEGLHYGMDYDFFLRIALNGKVEYIDEYFSKYLIHNESKTSTSSLLFAKEWAQIFKGFLSSLKNADFLLPMISHLGLKYEDVDLPYYTTSKVFSVEELEKIWCFHLLNQIVFRYEGGDLRSVRKLTSFIKQNYPCFFSDNKLMREYMRSRFLTKKSLHFLRYFCGSFKNVV